MADTVSASGVRASASQIVCESAEDSENMEIPIQQAWGGA